MPSNIIRIGVPLSLLPGIIASILCFTHAHRYLPKSWYSIGLQTAFALGLTTEIFGAIHYTIKAMTPTPTTNESDFFNVLYNMCFICHVAVYCVAQASFFRSFIPVNEVRTAWIIFVTRVMVVVAAGVAMCGYIGYAMMSDNDMVFKHMSFGCSGAVLSFDLMINGYMVIAALRRFRRVGRRLRLMLVGVWVIACVDFLVTIVITFGPGMENEIWEAIGDAFTNTYIQMSYLGIVVIRSMLVAYNAQPVGVASSHIHDSASPTGMANMTGTIHLAQSSIALSIDLPAVPNNSMVTQDSIE